MPIMKIIEVCFQNISHPVVFYEHMPVQEAASLLFSAFVSPSTSASWAKSGSAQSLQSLQKNVPTINSIAGFLCTDGEYISLEQACANPLAVPESVQLLLRSNQSTQTHPSKMTSGDCEERRHSHSPLLGAIIPTHGPLVERSHPYPVSRAQRQQASEAYHSAHLNAESITSPAAAKHHRRSASAATTSSHSRRSSLNRSFFNTSKCVVITSAFSFVELLEMNPERMILLLLTTPSSSQCLQLTETMHSLSENPLYHHKFVFATMDVDILLHSSILSAFLVPPAVPTLQFYQSGQALGQVIGINNEQVVRMVQNNDDLTKEFDDSTNSSIHHTLNQPFRSFGERASSSNISGNLSEQNQSIDSEQFTRTSSQIQPHLTMNLEHPSSNTNELLEDEETMLSEEEAIALKRLILKEDRAVQNALQVFPELHFISNAFKRLAKYSAEKKLQKLQMPKSSASAISPNSRQPMRIDTSSRFVSANDSFDRDAFAEDASPSIYSSVLQNTLSSMKAKGLLTNNETRLLQHCYNVEQQSGILGMLVEHQQTNNDDALMRNLQRIALQIQEDMLQKVKADAEPRTPKSPRSPMSPHVSHLSVNSKHSLSPLKSSPSARTPPSDTSDSATVRSLTHDIVMNAIHLLHQLYTTGKISAQENEMISNLLVRQHPLVMAAVIAFTKNEDIEDFLDTCHRILAKEGSSVSAVDEDRNGQASPNYRKNQNRTRSTNEHSDDLITLKVNRGRGEPSTAADIVCSPDPVLQLVLTLLPPSLPIITLFTSLIQAQDAVIMSAISVYRERLNTNRTISDEENENRDLRETIMTRVLRYEVEKKKKKRKEKRENSGLKVVTEIDEEEDSRSSEEQKSNLKGGEVDNLLYPKWTTIITTAEESSSPSYVAEKSEVNDVDQLTVAMAKSHIVETSSDRNLVTNENVDNAFDNMQAISQTEEATKETAGTIDAPKVSIEDEPLDDRSSNAP